VQAWNFEGFSFDRKRKEVSTGGFVGRGQNSGGVGESGSDGPAPHWVEHSWPRTGQSHGGGRRESRGDAEVEENAKRGKTKSHP